MNDNLNPNPEKKDKAPLTPPLDLEYDNADKPVTIGDLGLAEDSVITLGLDEESADPDADMDDSLRIIELDEGDGLAYDGDIDVFQLKETREYVHPTQDEYYRYIHYLNYQNGNKVPLDYMLTIIEIETGFNAIFNSALDLGSKAGTDDGWMAHGGKYDVAGGACQFIPGTARAYGLRVDGYAMDNLTGNVHEPAHQSSKAGKGRVSMSGHVYTLGRDGFHYLDSSDFMTGREHKFPVMDERMDFWDALPALVQYVTKLYERAVSEQEKVAGFLGELSMPVRVALGPIINHQYGTLANVSVQYNSGKSFMDILRIIKKKADKGLIQGTAEVAEYLSRKTTRQYIDYGNKAIKNYPKIAKKVRDRSDMLGSTAYYRPDVVQVAYPRDSKDRYEPITFGDLVEHGVNLFDLLDMNKSLQLRVPLIQMAPKGSINPPKHPGPRFSHSTYWNVASYSKGVLSFHDVGQEEAARYHSARKGSEIAHEDKSEHELVSYADMWQLTFQDIVNLGVEPSDILLSNPDLDISQLLSLAIPEGYELRLPTGKGAGVKTLIEKREYLNPGMAFSYDDLDNVLAESMYGETPYSKRRKLKGFKKDLEVLNLTEHPLYETLDAIHGRGITNSEKYSIFDSSDDMNTSLFDLLSDNPDIMLGLFSYLYERIAEKTKKMTRARTNPYTGVRQYEMADVRFMIMALRLYEEYGMKTQGANGQSYINHEHLPQIAQMRVILQSVARVNEHDKIRLKVAEEYKEGKKYFFIPKEIPEEERGAFKEVSGGFKAPPNPMLRGHVRKQVYKRTDDDIAFIDAHLGEAGHTFQRIDRMYDEMMDVYRSSSETGEKVDQARAHLQISVDAIAEKNEMISIGAPDFGIYQQVVGRTIRNEVVHPGVVIFPIKHNGNTIAYAEYELSKLEDGKAPKCNVYMMHLSSGLKKYLQKNTEKINIGSLYAPVTYYYGFTTFQYSPESRGNNSLIEIPGVDDLLALVRKSKGWSQVFLFKRSRGLNPFEFTDKEVVEQNMLSGKIIVKKEKKRGNPEFDLKFDLYVCNEADNKQWKHIAEFNLLEDAFEYVRSNGLPTLE